MYQVRLTYDRTLARPQTFFWIQDIATIRCRIKLGEADEVSPVDVHLRFRSAKSPGLVHVRQLDKDRFLTELAKIHDDLPKLELLLVGVPEPVASALRNL